MSSIQSNEEVQEMAHHLATMALSSDVRVSRPPKTSRASSRRDKKERAEQIMDIEDSTGRAVPMKIKEAFMDHTPDGRKCLLCVRRDSDFDPVELARAPSVEVFMFWACHLFPQSKPLCSRSLFNQCVLGSILIIGSS